MVAALLLELHPDRRALPTVRPTAWLMVILVGDARKIQRIVIAERAVKRTQHRLLHRDHRRRHPRHAVTQPMPARHQIINQLLMPTLPLFAIQRFRPIQRICRLRAKLLVALPITLVQLIFVMGVVGSFPPPRRLVAERTNA